MYLQLKLENVWESNGRQWGTAIRRPHDAVIRYNKGGGGGQQQGEGGSGGQSRGSGIAVYCKVDLPYISLMHQQPRIWQLTIC